MQQQWMLLSGSGYLLVSADFRAVVELRRRIRSVMGCEFSMSLITTGYVGFANLQPRGEKLTPFLHISKAFVLGHDLCSERR